MVHGAVEVDDGAVIRAEGKTDTVGTTVGVAEGITEDQVGELRARSDTPVGVLAVGVGEASAIAGEELTRRAGDATSGETQSRNVDTDGSSFGVSSSDGIASDGGGAFTDDGAISASIVDLVADTGELSTGDGDAGRSGNTSDARSGGELVVDDSSGSDNGVEFVQLELDGASEFLRRKDVGGTEFGGLLVRSDLGGREDALEDGRCGAGDGARAATDGESGASVLPAG